MTLTENERRTLARMIEAGEEIPNVWRAKLFPETPQSVEIGKEYRLEYAGKMKREQVLAETPAAPWQLVRSFNTGRPFDDGWKNLLVWGDNLLALRGLLADQQGPNHFGTKDKIKLIYIDPPFANLNAALEKAKEGWRYHFKFLSPKDYTGFFGALKSEKIADWKSNLLVDLSK